MRKPLNILYYNTFLPMKMGEGLVSRQFLVAALKLDGWQMQTIPMVTPAILAQSNVEERHKNVAKRGNNKKKWLALRRRLRRLKSPMSRFPLAPYLYEQQQFQQLDAALQNQTLDLLFFHLSQPDLAALARLCRQTNLPLVLRAPSPLAYQADHVIKRYMSGKDRENEKFLYEAADTILVISEGMKQLFAAQGVVPEKIQVVPNGIDLDAFAASGVEGQTVRQKFGLEGRKVVGYVGGFWPGNDLETLLKAWQQVEQTEAEAVLLLVGYGPDLISAQELSAELMLKNCVWTGRVDFSQVSDYMAAMDVGVGPYTKEALAFVSPLKVIEYTAMGLPVVAARGGQITELIEDGRTGLTYEAGCATQLAEHILSLLAAPEQARQMGRQARQHIQNWHSWDKIAQNVLSICQQVTEQAT
ncbi:MAG: glycosyltransferase [Chloroflexi bacterium]|nr:glycosyltransferase [Chloroflexota bacterium]